MEEVKVNYLQLGIDDGFEDKELRDNTTWTEKQRMDYRIGYAMGLKNADNYYYQQILNYGN